MKQGGAAAVIGRAPSTMSANASQEGSFVALDLPRPWLASLFQHVASGPGGLASAAALSQTCSSLHALSESSAVSYRNIHVRQTISRPDHPVWPWLANRQGRVSGLEMDVVVERYPTLQVPDSSLHGSDDADPEAVWMQPLQTLSAIPGLHLTVSCTGTIDSRDEPFMEEWLKPYGYLINALRAEIDVDAKWLSLSEFCRPAAPCRSIELTVLHTSRQTLNLSDLAPVLGSLVQLGIKGVEGRGLEELGSFDTLTSMPQLTRLLLTHLDLTTYTVDPWATLALLSSLGDLTMSVAAYGDAPGAFSSAMSGLTGLSRLELGSYDCFDEGEAAISFSFSSLQPLSTLQQLETLLLHYDVCGATSLQGLAGLSRLERLELSYASNLVSLEGISAAVTHLSIGEAKRLHDLSGIGILMGLEHLCVNMCGITSLQPLAGLRCLQSLEVLSCPMTSLEGLEGTLSTSLQSLKLWRCYSLRQLSGLERLFGLQQLDFSGCGVTSLQPLAELTGDLVKVSIGYCESVKEVVLELPHTQPTADVQVWNSNVKEVVLAGGVRRAVVDR